MGRKSMSRSAIRTLIIDNYDSFTFNLFQLLAEVNGEEPVVVRNDDASWLALELSASGGGLLHERFDNLVISPGPGTPERAADMGLSRDVLRRVTLPLLGVCLGHQGLAWGEGGRIAPAPEPMHGRLSPLFHDGSELFEGIPQGIQVVRYHSLMVANPLPAALRCTAWTSQPGTEDLIMGLAHREKPQYGVQFHPESICTEFGRQLLSNFRDLTRQHMPPRFSGVTLPQSPALETVPSKPEPAPAAPPLSHEPSSSAPFRLFSRQLPFFPEPERAFCTLFGEQEPAFWLDSSRVEPELSRFSYMGAGDGPHSFEVRHHADSNSTTIVRGAQQEEQFGPLLEHLALLLEAYQLSPDADSEALPFDFHGGFVGYFGYELKTRLMGLNPPSHGLESKTPDAHFLFADRLLAFDHRTSRVWMVSLARPDEEHEVQLWFDRTELRLAGAHAAVNRSETFEGTPKSVPEVAAGPLRFRLSRSPEVYRQDIAHCQRLIRDGESYELCLTNQLMMSPSPEPLSFYRTLRRYNPAPYAAFVRMAGVSVLCSSPERFLKLQRDGMLESKPIKGTRPRGLSVEADERLKAELAAHEKDRAENLMIVDLLRNDLGRVCEVGSVNVTKLMAVESYQTVHQLVSTIRGRLKPEFSALDCVGAAFPGGSMTGAPKHRSVQLLEGLEQEPRGVYSGALGFLSVNRTMDLNIVIRTLVVTAAGASLGIGGAIVAMSEPEEEFEETLVKARALVSAYLRTQKMRSSGAGLAPSDAEISALTEQVLAGLRRAGESEVW